MKEISEKLHDKDEGHNKFLESIIIWAEVTAPRYWWQEADTYRLSTKQSESTMHTLIEEIERTFPGLPEAFSNLEFLKLGFEPESITLEQYMHLCQAVKNKDISLLKRRLS